MVKCSETTHLSDSRGIWFACGSLVTRDPKSRPRQHRWRRAQSPEESRPTWYCYLQICCLRSWLWGDRLKGMDDQKTLILRVQGKVSNINTAANVMCSERHQKESQWWGLLAENGTPGAWAAHLAWFPTPGCPSTRPRCPSSIPANSCFLLCCHSNKSSYLKNCAIKKIGSRYRCLFGVPHYHYPLFRWSVQSCHYPVVIFRRGSWSWTQFRSIANQIHYNAWWDEAVYDALLVTLIS